MLSWTEYRTFSFDVKAGRPHTVKGILLCVLSVTNSATLSALCQAPLYLKLRFLSSFVSFNLFMIFSNSFSFISQALSIFLSFLTWDWSVSNSLHLENVAFSLALLQPSTALLLRLLQFLIRLPPPAVYSGQFLSFQFFQPGRVSNRVRTNLAFFHWSIFWPQILFLSPPPR